MEEVTKALIPSQREEHQKTIKDQDSATVKQRQRKWIKTKETVSLPSKHDAKILQELEARGTCNLEEDSRRTKQIKQKEHSRTKKELLHQPTLEMDKEPPKTEIVSSDKMKIKAQSTPKRHHPVEKFNRVMETNWIAIAPAGLLRGGVSNLLKRNEHRRATCSRWTFEHDKMIMVIKCQMIKRPFRQ
jgi:glucan-binding YG repeat protein